MTWPNIGAEHPLAMEFRRRLDVQAAMGPQHVQIAEIVVQRPKD